MKHLILLSFLVFCQAHADEYVNGYYRKDGTYVQGYYRSKANDTKLDNYSTKGNYNPYTGDYGTKDYDDYNNYGYESSDSDTGW